MSIYLINVSKSIQCQRNVVKFRGLNVKHFIKRSNWCVCDARFSLIAWKTNKIKWNEIKWKKKTLKKNSIRNKNELRMSNWRSHSCELDEMLQSSSMLSAESERREMRHTAETTTTPHNFNGHQESWVKTAKRFDDDDDIAPTAHHTIHLALAQEWDRGRESTSSKPWSPS